MNKKRIINFMSNNAIVLLLLALVVFVTIREPNFKSFNNIVNILSNTSVRFILALGVSGTLITKGTDLSAGRIAGLGGVIACTLLQKPDYAAKFFPDLPMMPVFVVFLIVIAITGFIGLINGFVVSKFKVPPFLATLGMQQLVYGANLVYSGAEPIGGLQKAYTDVATGKLFGSATWAPEVIKIPYIIIFAILIAIAMWFLYNKTRHGKYMYAIGGNEHAAEVSGINTFTSKLKIYALAGVLYGVAGFLLAAKAGGASVNLGMGYELEAIAACTIGGVSTTGGVGKVKGILLGVLVFELMKTSLQFLGVDPSYQYVAQGLVIIAAVALDIRKYTVKK